MVCDVIRTETASLRRDAAAETKLGQSSRNGLGKLRDKEAERAGEGRVGLGVRSKLTGPNLLVGVNTLTKTSTEF